MGTFLSKIVKERKKVLMVFVYIARVSYLVQTCHVSKASSSARTQLLCCFTTSAFTTLTLRVMRSVSMIEFLACKGCVFLVCSSWLFCFNATISNTVFASRFVLSVLAVRSRRDFFRCSLAQRGRPCGPGCRSP